LPRETCALLDACAENANAAQSGTEQSGSEPMGLDEPVLDQVGDEQPTEEPVVMEAGPAHLIPPSSDTLGMGDCQEASVADVAALAGEENPELAGITEFVPHPIYEEPAPDPGSDYYQAVVSDSSIFLAFRRCVGNIVQGECDDVLLDFYATEAACTPVATGSYRATLSGEGCYDVSGDASPEFPELAVAERDRCDFDPMPEAVAGNFQLTGAGMGSICEQEIVTPTSMELTIVQDADDPAMATITFSNTGFQCIDDVSFPGRVIMGLVEGELFLSEAGSRAEGDLCAPPAKLDFSLGGDWGGLPFVGLLDYSVLAGDGCGDAGPEYLVEGTVHFSFADGGG